MEEEFEFDGRRWKVGGWGGIEIIEDGYKGYSDYQEIIERLHPELKRWIWEHEDDYQGDFYGVGIDDEGWYYFVSGSFGSCSGCDWLESISGKTDAIKFLNHYKKVIIPKEEDHEMKKYLEFEKINSYWKEGIQNLLDRLDSLSEKGIGEKVAG